MFELQPKAPRSFKIFYGGDIFVNYDNETDEVTYIENIPNKKRFHSCRLVTVKLNDKYEEITPSE